MDETTAAAAINAVPVSTLPRDLSAWGMLVAADIVVQVIMGLLLAAALLVWVVCLAKSWQLAAARRRVAHALAILQSTDTLEGIGVTGDQGVLHLFCATARLERERSDGLHPTGIKERAEASVASIEAALGRRMSRGTGTLATIGATAPFVGLLGTVWGVMNSFIGISEAQSTNLAVVAPGIAEALLATALGLFAAVPAVIIYNALARGIANYSALLADTGTEVLNLLGRDLDRAQP